jgi:ATP-binding cassette subfamily B protein
VALADRVALLAGGEIAAVGTHSELLETVPAYRAALSADALGPGEDGQRSGAFSSGVSDDVVSR